MSEPKKGYGALGVMAKGAACEMTASAIAAYAQSGDTHVAVVWGLVRGIPAVIMMAACLVALGMFHRWFLADLWMICRSCGARKDVGERHMESFRGALTCECGNRVRRDDSTASATSRLTAVVTVVLVCAWGAVLAANVPGPWYIGLLVYVAASRFFERANRYLTLPPRTRRGLTPEGFEVEVPEDTGFRMVWCCRACGRDSLVNETKDSHPTAAEPLCEGLECPHCDAPFVKSKDSA
jgi:hypothetical protein